ncbi:hypothetical protein RHABOEDO_000856 [Candidatus Rhabdochlamydia oedothoracis]|uniref:Uncharacterized protein n=1 Tax=Candidatus Rhabdochlamydia oedothoracis TaxID=2720720 RepID=A0ABX8V0K4_9BACT|nr:hypothetical protein RHABOEDO_000856 [Candidatus Rhabdochlamydia oedothoracis]
MTINRSGNHSPEGHARINLDELFNSSSMNPQTALAYAKVQMISNLTKSM